MSATGLGRDGLPDAGAAREARGEAVACPSCGSALTGRFCSQCGQERRPRDDLTVRRAVGEPAREFVDPEAGALGTLGDLLLRPGSLPAEYRAGRRRAHVGPAKRYVLVSFVFFLFAWERLLEHGGFSRSFEPGGNLYPLIVQRGMAVEVFAERFNQHFAEYATWLRFSSVLVSGLLMKLLYLGMWRLFAERLIFSFYYFAFDFSVNVAYEPLLIGVAAATGAEIPASGFWIAYVLVLICAYLALRRVYAELALKAAVKAVFFTAGQIASYFGAIFVGVPLAFWLA